MKCEYCSKEHDGKYGSGRFCCQECARGFSTKAKRKEINKKVSKKLSRKNKISKMISERNKKMFADGWKPWEKVSNEQRLKSLERGRETQRKNWEKRSAFVITRHNDERIKVVLDITNGDLEKYRQSHPVCEICGKGERIKTNPNSSKTPKLAVDHIHGTDKFRGLLCNRCNYLLGWVEEVGIDSLSSYLNKLEGQSDR